MLYLLNPKLWIALAIAAALSVGAWRVHSAGKASGRAEVQTKFDAYRLAAEKAEAEAKAAARFDKFLAQEEVWIRKGVEARRTRSVARIQRLEVLRLL